VARKTGFSPSSITLIVNRMMRRGWIEEVRSGGGSGLGRRPGALRLRPEALVAVGVEIRAPFSRVVAADLNGVFLSTQNVAFDPNPQILLSRVRAAIVTLSRKFLKYHSLIGVGVSLPGTIDGATGAVHAAENLGWYDVEAGRILSDGISIPFHFENNARLAALAEKWFAAPGAAAMNHFVFVTMRDGLGTGVIIDGKLLQGRLRPGGRVRAHDPVPRRTSMSLRQHGLLGRVRLRPRVGALLHGASRRRKNFR
jgi:predicted NBD/HSP70 family sugar kinase